MQTLPWILASIASTLFAASLAAWAWQDRRSRRLEALPTDWQLTARPVFSTDERRLYRSLREALPHHVLLSKLPLVRFCEPTDPDEARYWHDLLGSSYVGFAICSANGRVLAAVDLDSDRGASRRMARIKQSALGACRVRYLRCAVDHLPSIAELQLLVPTTGASTPSPPPTATTAASAPVPHRDPPPPQRRPARSMLWQDTAVFEDSFFPANDTPGVAGTDAYAPVRGRRINGVTRSVPTRSAGAFDTRRRREPPADFAPTRNSFDEDENDAEPGRAPGAGQPRSIPGSRP